MKISNTLSMFSLSSHLANGPTIIHPVIIHNTHDVILVDAGFPGQLQQFRDAFQNASIPFEKLNKIIITHSDMDHVGGLSSIIDESSQKIEVLAHSAEKPYIQCEQPPIRLSQMEESLQLLQGEQLLQMKMLYEKLKANYKNLQAVVDKTVTDGQILPYCRGIEIIYTPGHTPGHICLYLKETKTLIAGDIFNVENHQLVPAPDFTTIDKNLAIASLKKLVQYDIEKVICYHGGMYTSDVNSRIREIANQ